MMSSRRSSAPEDTTIVNISGGDVESEERHIVSPSHSNSGGDVELVDLQHVSPSHSNSGGDVESTERQFVSRKSGVDQDGGGDRGGGDDQDLGDDIQRTSNMWIAAAFNITAIIGVGVLSLPYAMVFLTWRGGPVVLVLAFFITYFTMRQLVQLHEFEFLNKGIRYGTYRDLGGRAFGYGKGLWIILPLQMVVEVSLDILFTVTAGEAMNRIYDTPSNQCIPVHLFIWFAVFATIQIGLSVVIPTFESLAWIAILAAIMSICYSTIAWSTVVSLGDSNSHPKYTLPSSTTEKSLKDDIFRVFNAIGVVAFTYAAHNVVLEIQNGIPTIQENSPPIRGESPEISRSTTLRQYTSIPVMMRGVWITYAVVAVCYFPMAIAVYAIHGNQISSNVLSFIQYGLVEHAPTRLIVATNIMLIIHLIGSYQIFAMPIFKQLEKWSFKFSFIQNSPLRNYAQYIIRLLYIVFTTTLAMIFPYFSPLLGFFGGFAMAPTSFFLPCIIYLRLKKPKRWSSDWCFNWAFIILGILLMIVATIGGLYLLIKQSIADKYELWTPNWKKNSFYTFEICTSTN